MTGQPCCIAASQTHRNPAAGLPGFCVASEEEGEGSGDDQAASGRLRISTASLTFAFSGAKASLATFSDRSEIFELSARKPSIEFLANMLCRSTTSCTVLAA